MDYETLSHSKSDYKITWCAISRQGTLGLVVGPNSLLQEPAKGRRGRKAANMHTLFVDVSDSVRMRVCRSHVRDYPTTDRSLF